MPYTFGNCTGGAALAKNTLFAPASRAICTICWLVVPRTMESSTISTLRPLNSTRIALKGRNVLIVDDSIVRGTTSQQIVQMARDAGANKVFFASAAPP